MLLCLAILGLASYSHAACTLGTNTCCLATGGASDNPATKIIWEPDNGTTTWKDTGNWNPNAIPDASGESSYVQSDWQVPAWPSNSYTLSCLEIASGSMTAQPAAAAVTMANSTATVTISNPTATVTMTGPQTVTMNAPATVTMNAPTTVTFSAPTTITFTIPSATITMTSANPGVTTYTAHGMATTSTPIRYRTTGALPTNIVAGTVYYIRNIATNTFRMANTPGGGSINTTAGTQSGTHTCYQPIRVDWTSHGLVAGDTVQFGTDGTLPTGLSTSTTYYVAALPAPTTNAFWVSATNGGVAIVGDNGSGSGTMYGYRPLVVTLNSHGLAANTPVSFTTSGSLPTGLTPSTTYYVAGTPAPATNTFSLSTTAGGAAIYATSAGSGTQTIQRPIIVTFNSHGFAASTPVSFTSSGSLPGGLTASTTYYVASLPAIATNTFAVSTTAGGEAILGTSAGSGTHTCNQPVIVTLASHGLSANTPVQFTTSGSLPTGLSPSTTYYLASLPAVATNTFAVSASAGGTAILGTAAGSGTHTLQRPSAISWTAHGLATDNPVSFTTTGSLPTGLTASTTYYVAGTPAASANTFYVSATKGGDAIVTSSAGSGTHTGRRPPIITWTSHGLNAGTPISLTTTGSLPGGLSPSTTYYLTSNPATATNTFSLSATSGGDGIIGTSNGSGTHTAYRPTTVTYNAHGMVANTPVRFAGTMPTGLTAGTTYYVTSAPAPATNTFSISSTPGGDALFSTGTGSGITLDAFYLSVNAEYFENQNPGSLATNSNFFIRMNGSNEQTLDNVDTIHNLMISNGTTVSLPSAFTVSTSFVISSGTGTISIGEGLNLTYTGTPLNIPASATLEVESGAVLTAMSGITVDGVLKINAGGRVLIGDTKTLQVNAGGLLSMIGTAGNVASLDADQGDSTFTLNVAGSINANYFSISRTTTNGLNITTGGSDTIQTLSNGDFHYIASNGYAITLNTTKNLPNPDPSNLGFFDDFAYGNIHNIHANSYTGNAVTIDGHAGFSGTTYETDTGNKIAWGSAASPALQVTNRTASGSPGSTIAKGASATLFATYGFSLNQASTSTDITSVTLTLDGNNVASDVNYIQVFSDQGGSNTCEYDSGSDTQIGSNLTMSGSPPTATVTIPASTITVSNTTQVCIHVLLATNANAQTDDTLQMSIVGTTDVSNSNGYSFSNSSGPPVSGTVSTITGSAIKRWNGGNGGAGAARNWNAAAGDWTPSGTPISSDDCEIGPAYSYASMNGNYSCTNMHLADNGRMGWAGGSNTLTVLGALTIGSNYTFTSATSGIISLASTVASQSIEAETTFPGNLVINNTYGSNGLVTIDSDLTITGSLTLTAGVLTVTNGHNLTVNGGITVNGGTLKIDPGATLTMGDGDTLTVNASGTLSMVGTASQSAAFQCGGTTTGCLVTINGTIQAQYYSFYGLRGAGVNVISTASIDSTYHLQNGTFSYPVGSSAVLLTLGRQVPTNTLDNMVFETGGSGAASPQSIVTTAAAGTCTLSSYSGNLTGDSFDTDLPYDLTWQLPTTTLKLTLEASAPTTVDQGDTAEIIARYGFQQTDAGTYSDTDITAIKVTLQGSQDSSDVSAVRLYYDSGCTGSGGTQKGSSLTFSGSPPTANFTGLTGITIPTDVSAPAKRCVYFEFDIASAATVGNTLGVSIVSSGDVTNSQSYAFNGSYDPPLSGGTSIVNGNTITWTGTTSSDWATTSNWNLARLPTSSDNCIIQDQTNDPTISASGAVCKSVTIGNGVLTINTGQTLSVYGSYTNTGTLTLNGTASLTIRDDGSTTTNQTLQSSSALTNLAFNKTAGGYIYIGNQTLTIDNFSIPSGQTFTFNVRNGETLTLPQGATLSSATMQVDGGGIVKVTSGQEFLVSGATLTTVGTNDGYPQSTSNKAKFTINGSGTWAMRATSGTLDLTGFLFDYLDVNGLQVNGTTTLSHLDGGHFSNLSNTYASVKAIQINTSGSLPATADYVGFNWGANNTPPAITDGYLLGYSSGCSNHSMTFTNWWGDFFYGVDIPVAQSKISTSSCTLTMTAAASAVEFTEFKATPYDSKVIVSWTTGLEIMHQGFNVYRSVTPDDGFVQVNASLLRNPLATGTVHGSYQFYDGSVVNGTTYYYKVEDIAANGKRTLRGPLAATPDASLGAAPAPSSGSIVANDGMPAPATPAPTPGTLVGTESILAPGVTLLTKTNHSLRLKIDVPAIVRNPSDLPPYEQVTIPGYSSTTIANYPELPERTILVEIPAAETAAFREVRRTSAVINNIDVSPARAWTVVNGSLVPQPLSIDAAFYGTNQALPSTPIVLGEVVQNQGLSYLPVTIKPLKYNPVTREVTALSQIVIDITLAGVPEWNIGGAEMASGPWGFEGALKIHLNQSGLYQLSYDEIADLGLEGPFDGANVAKLRLYSSAGELPLQVNSADGFFSTGDSIRFFAPYFDNAFTDRNTVILVVSASNGARMASVPGAVTGVASSQASYDRRVQVKQPGYGLFQESYGADLEHIFWGGIYSPPQTPGHERLSTDISLPGIAGSGTVKVKAYVKGSPGAHIQNPNHHVRLFVNNSTTPSGDITFQTNSSQVLIFSVPASYFVDGLNTIALEAVGDLTPGDYDFVNIEKFVVDYPHRWFAEGGFADVMNYQAGKTLSISGFPAEDIQIYDITDITMTGVLTGFDVIDNGADGYGVDFGTVSGNSVRGRRFIAVADSAVLSPWSLELNAGSNLRGTNQGADVLYVGPKALLDAVAPLAELRAGQGFRVKRVRLEDIYQEFGSGIRSPLAVKNFLAFAAANWQSPAPKYVILVGDATFDPKNQLGYGTFPQAPLHLSKGHYVDYGDDNWFVALGDEPDVPSMAIGRIPGRTAFAVGTYVAKVLAYESGSARPSGAAAAKMILASDTDQVGGEHFEERADTLAGHLANWNNSLHITRLSRVVLGDAQLKTGLLQAFQNGASMIHYMGHGAEDRWAGPSVFMNADAAGLVNTTLPVVIAMNCLNGYYYDPDPAFISLAEKLLFNQGGGAIAVWASTSLTSPDVQAPFQLSLYQIIAGNPGIRLGDAIRLAKIAGGINTGTAEVVGSWNLLGDPMIEMKIPAKTDGSLGIATSPVEKPTAVEEESAASVGGSCLAVHRKDGAPTKPDLGLAVQWIAIFGSLIAGRFIRRRREKSGKL